MTSVRVHGTTTRRQEGRVNRLVQLDISKPMEAMDVFNATVNDGRIPLVLIPTYPHFLTPFMLVPSGLWVLKQKWNAHIGMMDPGLKMFWPAWNRVSHIVTKQAVSYSNHIMDVPTSDNVMIDIGISISFQIGPTEDDVVRFVYSLGANRFDELLFSLMEEAIRGLVHSVRHDQVHDLREEFALGMKKDLNTKLKEFGVFIHNVKVTDVALPPALSRTLEATTAFKTKMEEQEKNHENQLRILVNEEKLKLTSLEKENERKVQDLLANKTRTIIHRDEMRTMADAKQQVEIAQVIAQTDNVIKVDVGLKDDAVATATAEAVKRKALPTVELSALKEDFDQFVQVATIKRDGVIKAAERNAAKIKTSAESEGRAAESLVARRAFELEAKKIRLENHLAATVPLVVSGKNGDQLIAKTILRALEPTS